MLEKFSHLVDFIKLPKGYIYKRGFLMGNNSIEKNLLNSIKDIEIEDGTAQEILHSNESQKILDCFFKYNPEIKEAISQYKCNYEFDIAYLFSTKINNSQNHRNSQLWHHDSVGHRLKLFIALKHGWKTYYLEDSHKKKNFFSSFQNEKKRLLIGKTLQGQMKSSYIELKKGDWLLFDTNGLHKGFSDENFQGSILVFEFSNTLKKSWMGKVGKRHKL